MELDKKDDKAFHTWNHEYMYEYSPNFITFLIYSVIIIHDIILLHCFITFILFCYLF